MSDPAPLRATEPVFYWTRFAHDRKPCHSDVFVTREGAEQWGHGNRERPTRASLGFEVVPLYAGTPPGDWCEHAYYGEQGWVRALVCSKCDHTAAVDDPPVIQEAPPRDIAKLVEAMEDILRQWDDTDMPPRECVAEMRAIARRALNEYRGEKE